MWEEISCVRPSDPERGRNFRSRAQSEALGAQTFGEAMLRGMRLERDNVMTIADTANIAVFFVLIASNIGAGHTFACPP